MKEYEITLSLTKTIEAENEDEAFSKAFDEFMEEGVNPNCFYIYVDGEPYK